MFEVRAPLVERRQSGGGMVVLSFEAPEIAGAARAGQFVNLGLRPGPLLRRPFSVHRASDGRVEVLLRAVGEGTGQLLEMASGGAVSMLGPLGRPFLIDPGWRSVALLSGGLGAAPMPLAAHEARAAGVRVHWVHGARDAASLHKEWEGDEAHWATDDGSRGHRGSALDAVPAEVDGVLACGPNPMLAAVARRWPEAQVAVETAMGCGTGVCLGCVVPLATGGYDRACTEGPVYRAASVRWEALPGHLHYAVGA